MTTPTSLAIEVTAAGERMVVTPHGEIDFGNVAELRTSLVDLTKQETVDVAVDLSRVTFLDSTALSVLVQGKQKLKEAGRQMTVVNAQPRVARILELAGLEDYLTG